MIAASTRWMLTSLVSIFMVTRICFFKKQGSGNSRFWDLRSGRYVRYSILIIVFLFFGFTTASGQAASGTWALTSNSSASASGNVVAGNMTGGGGISAISYSTSGSGSFGWDSPGRDNNDYYQYTLTPIAQNTFLFKSISLEHSVSVGNMDLAIYYSLDGFATPGTQLGGNVTVNTGISALNLTFSVLVDYGESLTLRVYGWNANQPTTVFHNRNVILSGTTCAMPTEYNVTGGGAYCSGGSGIGISLDGSEVGVEYQLFIGTLAVGSSVAGTGSAISFGNQTSAGTYKAEATRSDGGCTSTMKESATVAINPVPTLTAASQLVPVCENNQAVIQMLGLLPDAVFSVDYTINGTPQPQVSGVVSDASGTASFTTSVLQAANNGQILQISGLTITSSNPACYSSFSQNVLLQVYSIPSFIACPPGPVTAFTSATSCSSIVDYTVQSTGLPAPVMTFSFSGATTGSGSGTGTGSVFNAGTTQVMVVSTNACGTDTCSFEVIVTDNVPPVITCPADLLVSANSSCNASGVNLGVPVATDNCLVSAVTSNAPAIFPLGTTIVTWTVTDNSGLTASCTQNVTVTDDTPPQIACPVNVTAYTNSGCTATGVVLGTPVTNDNCGVAGVSNNAPAVFPVGVTQVIWTVTDLAGLSSTCTQTVTVIDDDPPTISCPADITTNANNGCTATGLNLGTPVTADNCSVASVGNNAPAAFPVGVTIVTWVVTDGSGNTASCTQTITVNDVTPPVITCPTPAASYNTDLNLCSRSLSFTATATDNCAVSQIKYFIGGTEITFPYTFPKGTTMVTAVAYDASNNSSQCSFNVTVVDVQAPVITCPGNQTRNTTAGTCNYTVSGNEFDPPSFADNCPGSTITNNYNNSGTLANAVFPEGFTLVTWTIKDASNNISSCSFSVTIIDNQAPVILNCPSNITVYTGPGRLTCNQAATWVPPTATDNCNPGGVIITSTHPPGTIFPVGNTLVTYTATDPSGNSSTCSFTVTVIDNTPPTFTAPANVTIYIDADCNYNASVAFTGDVINEFDNCTPTGLQATIANDATVAGTCPGTYTITRTWQLTDIYGNTTTHQQVIQVKDNTKPILSIPANKTVQCNESTMPGNTGQATATDNSEKCLGLVTITYTDNTVAGTCPDNFTISRTWFATDCSGNMTSGVQVISVVDNTPPVASVSNLTVACPDDIPYPNPAIVTTSDNCGDVTTVLFDEIPYGLENQPGYCPYRVDRIYRSTDQCGNFTDVTQIITIQGLCGCSPCATTNAFFVIDLEGQPNGDTTIYNVQRKDKCCDATKAYCASFNVRIDDDAVGVQILIDGATPSPQDWRIDCEGVEINDGVICIPGGAFHLFTFCKPGANLNNFTFISIQGVVSSEDITARVDCGTQITVSSNVTNPVWNSISPGDYGQYNQYLYPSNTTLNPVFVPDGNSPPEIQYQICGSIGSFYCNAAGTDCDTITVYVRDSVFITLNIDPSNLCHNENPLLIAYVDPPGNYIYQWFNAFNGGGLQVSGDSTLNPSGPGQYSVIVNDIQNNFPCGTDTLNFIVGFDETPPVVTPPGDLIVECNDPNAPQIIADWLSQATASDDGGVTFLPVTNNFTGILHSCNSVVTVVFSADDRCGNTGTASATISVTDTQEPVWLTLPGDLNRTVLCSDATGLSLAQAEEPFAIDNCDLSLVLVKTSGAFIMGSCPQAGSYTNTWTTTDACGNISQVYTQIITIIDNIAPAWSTLPGTLNRNLDCSDVAGINAAQALSPSATDNCDLSLVPVRTAGIFVPGICANTGTYTNTWTVTDDCGNMSSIYTQVISVSDVTPPVISTPAQNMVVECDGSGNLAELNAWLSANAGAIGFDSCSATLAWTNNFSSLNDLCGLTGTTSVVFTVTDLCGNSSQTSASFTIADTQAPAISCPSTVTAYLDPANCLSGTVNLGTASATDVCSGPVTVTNNAVAGGFPVGTNYVTWTATDACGNSDTCIQTVIVLDTTAPVNVTCPTDVTADAEPGECGANLTVPSPVVTDPCGVVIVTNSFNNTSNASGFYPVGVTQVTWTISDTSGNSTTCLQIVTVHDTQLPTIACPSNVTFTAPPPDCQLNIGVIDPPVLSDNCDIADLILTYQLAGATTGNGTGTVSGLIFNVGVTTVTYVVADSTGNSSTCSFTVTIHDQVPPTILDCPDDMTMNAEPGSCAAFVPVPSPVVVDPCGEIVSVINSFNGTSNASGNYPVGITTVTWTVTDVSGNVTLCSQLVNVLDTEFPVLTCPPDAFAIAAPPLCQVPSIVVQDPVYSDNCASPQLTWIKSGATTGTGTGLVNNTPFNVGVTVVTYILTDASGNEVSCTFNVTVNDQVPPTIIECPPPVITSNTDPDQCFASLVISPPVVNDPCGEIVSVVNSFNGTGNASGQYPVGTTVVLWTITDESGNTVNCSQNIIISDNQVPELVCPADVTAIATAPLCEVPSIIVGDPVFSDNCPNPQLSWTKTGATTGTGTGTVNNTSFHVGVTVVTYTVEDASGNITSCSFTVTINDQLPPTIIECPPAAVNASTDPGQCYASLVIPAPVVDDPCGEIVSVVNNFNNTGNASGQYPVGVTIVTWTITDESGNSVSCIQTITVADDQLPQLICPADVTAIATPPLCEVPAIVVGDPVFSDNCPNPVLSWTKTGATTGSGTGTVNNTTFHVGVTTVTYTVTDASGNTVSCSFTVTVNDQVPPTIIQCPAAVINATTDPDQCYADLTIDVPVVTDPCGEIVSVVNSFNGTGNASGQYPVGVTVVTWTITDESGNTVNCIQTVTVTDTQLPELICPGDVTAIATAPLCEVPSIVVADPVYSDNCPNPVLSWTMTGATTGSGSGTVNNEPFHVGITLVTYTVIDVNGNSVSCSFTVTVNDQLPPTVITCPPDVTQNADPDSCQAFVNVQAPVVSDPCNEIVSIVHNSAYSGSPSNASGMYPVGVHTITWTFTDESGNQSNCTQVITVADITDPELVCPPDFVVDADFEKTYASNVPIPAPIYSDACTVVTLTWVMSGATNGSSPVSGINILTVQTLNVGVTTITYTAVDPSGNSSTCAFNITVLSEPVIECPADLSVQNDPGLCSAALDPGQPTLLSGVEPIVWTWEMTGATVASGTGRPVNPIPYTFNVGITTIRWIATNVSGADTCIQLITVTDEEPPAFTVPGPFSFCVEDIYTADYFDPTMDIQPDRPEYYVFVAGSTVLDVDPSTITDNCSLSCTPELRWRISFADGTFLPALPALYLTGQPSAYGVNVQLPGHPTNNVNHSISYQLVDCNGNASAVYTVQITITPRPNVIKQ